MANSLPHFNIGTYTQIIIANYHKLHNVIRDRTTTVTDKINTNSEITNDPTVKVLTDKQLDDALNGPMAEFFKAYFNEYSLVAFLQQRIVQLNDEIFSPLPDTGSRYYECSRAQMKKITVTEIEMIEKKINSHLLEFDDKWSDLINQSFQGVIAGFESIGINLNEDDVNEITNPYTISELVDRLTQVNEEYEHNTEEPFKNYFRHKCKLAAHNAISRQQEALDDKKMKNILKSLNPALQRIESEKEALMKEQLNSLQDITKPFSFAIRPQA